MFVSNERAGSVTWGLYEVSRVCNIVVHPDYGTIPELQRITYEDSVLNGREKGA